MIAHFDEVMSFLNDESSSIFRSFPGLSLKDLECKNRYMQASLASFVSCVSLARYLVADIGG